MQETRLQRHHRYDYNPKTRSKRIVPWVVTVIVLLISASLFLSYAKHNQKIVQAQVALLKKHWASDQSNGMKSSQFISLQNQLSDIEKAHYGPVPASWFPRLAGVHKHLKLLNDQTKTLWFKELSHAKYQALAALSKLKKTEGSHFTNTKLYQTLLHKAKTPLDYENLEKKWTKERQNWTEDESKLKKISGGWINHQPADIVTDENQLNKLLKSLSSHPSDKKEASEVLKQTKQYLGRSSPSQLQQHSAIKSKLQSMITKVKHDETVPVSSNSWLFNKTLTDYINDRKGQISVAVYNANSGHTYLFNQQLEFDTASIVKVSIMADLLHQSEETGKPLNQQVKDLMVPMIEKSSNTAATKLWKMAGGAKGIEEILKLAGMTKTTPGSNGEWGLTKTTALDQVKIMRLFAFPNAILDNQERKFGLNLMEHITPWERWGVSNGVPSNGTVALKNGWLPYPKKWWINSIGYISGAGRNYVIAVLTGENPSEKYGIDTINHISDMIWSQLGPQ